MEPAIERAPIEQARRVAPTTLARERTLPVPPGLAGLLPEGGIVRGRILACSGPAATSLALALVAPTVATGSWLALVDLPTIGLDAVGEAGIALERVVAVTSQDPVATMVAAADGFDMVLTRGVGASGARSAVRPAVAERLRARVQRRGAVVVVIGDPGGLPCDGVLTTADPSWEGLGDGHGRLCRRTVEVRSGGRRIPGGRRCRVHLPAPGPTDTDTDAIGATGPDGRDVPDDPDTPDGPPRRSPGGSAGGPPGLVLAG